MSDEKRPEPDDVRRVNANEPMSMTDTVLEIFRKNDLREVWLSSPANSSCDPESIADGMLDALRRRNELATAGLARVAGRTWLDVARETLSVYDRALAAT